jgi:hypothetical protein
MSGGVNFSVLVYDPCFDMFAVDCTFVTASGAFAGRGIYNTDRLSVPTEEGTILGDQQTVLDILEAEFTTLPQQLDHVTIPYDCNGAPLGEFEITEAWTNGGGQTTLVIRSVEVKDGT